MKGLQRVLKVRETQKRLKERAMLRASSHCASLENNAQRIRKLHAETRHGEATGSADLFAAKMELSDRLLQASDIVAASVGVARQDFAAAERQNFAARAVHDGTEKLLNSRLSKPSFISRSSTVCSAAALSMNLGPWCGFSSLCSQRPKPT